MKRFLFFSLILIVLLTCTYSHAALIGLEAGPLPDVFFDTTGTVTYTAPVAPATSGLFTLTADDETLTYPSGGEDYLSGLGYKTAFSLSGYVDTSGNWTGGIAGYDMVEEVVQGQVTIKGQTYGVGTILLQGEVAAFGWDNLQPGNIPKFDFLIDKNTLGGVLTTIASAPDLPWPTDNHTGIIATGETNYTINWSSDMTISRMKGDKFPNVPEPISLILLGSGLIGIIGYGKRKEKNPQC